MDIFEQLDLLLIESERKSKTKESDIPIHPEMETKEQGRIAVAEEYIKIFQDFKGDSSGSEPDKPEEVKDSRPSLPDSIIDPELKDTIKKSKEKTFEKNKLVDWDEKFKEKVKKEVGMGDEDDDDFDDFDYRDSKFGDDDKHDEFEGEDGEFEGEDGGEGKKSKSSPGEDDEFEDFDYRDNQFGDDDDDGGTGQPGGGGYGEDEDNIDKKLKDTIRDGIDSLKKMKGEGKPSGHNPDPLSGKQLDDLMDTINSDDNDIQDVRDKMEDIKNPKENTEIAGSQMENPSDDDVRNDMKKSGLDDETIDKMIKEKNTDTSKDYSDDEIEKMKKDAVDSLVGDAEEKGKATSSLASSIVKHSLKQTIVDGEWRTLLEKFLHSKSVVNKGNMSTTNKGVGWNTKTHAYRGAVLPKIDAESKATIKNIYCFIDFSGSCEQKLVFSFLGKVIDLAFEKLKYTRIHIYGFADNLTPCSIIDDKSLKHGKEKVLEDTWRFISGQISGGAIENFMDVSVEIRKIKKEESDAVILIFGDAMWPEYNQSTYEKYGITFKYKSKTGTVGPICLKNILQKKNLDDICVLAYYEIYKDNNRMTEYNKERCYSYINYLKQIVGIKNIITTGSNLLEE